MNTYSQCLQKSSYYLYEESQLSSNYYRYLFKDYCMRIQIYSSCNIQEEFTDCIKIINSLFKTLYASPKLKEELIYPFNRSVLSRFGNKKRYFDNINHWSISLEDFSFFARSAMEPKSDDREFSNNHQFVRSENNFNSGGVDPRYLSGSHQFRCLNNSALNEAVGSHNSTMRDMLAFSEIASREMNAGCNFQSQRVPREMNAGWNIDSERVSREMNVNWNIDSERVSREMNVGWNFNSDRASREVNIGWNFNSVGVSREMNVGWNFDSERASREIAVSWNFNSAGVSREMNAGWNLDSGRVSREMNAGWNLDSERVSSDNVRKGNFKRVIQTTQNPYLYVSHTAGVVHNEAPPINAIQAPRASATMSSSCIPGIIGGRMPSEYRNSECEYILPHDLEFTMRSSNSEMPHYSSGTNQNVSSLEASAANNSLHNDWKMRKKTEDTFDGKASARLQCQEQSSDAGAGPSWASGCTSTNYCQIPGWELRQTMVLNGKLVLNPWTPLDSTTVRDNVDETPRSSADISRLNALKIELKNEAHDLLRDISNLDKIEEELVPVEYCMPTLGGSTTYTESYEGIFPDNPYNNVEEAREQNIQFSANAQQPEVADNCYIEDDEDDDDNDDEDSYTYPAGTTADQFGFTSSMNINGAINAPDSGYQYSYPYQFSGYGGYSYNSFNPPTHYSSIGYSGYNQGYDTGYQVGQSIAPGMNFATHQFYQHGQAGSFVSTCCAESSQLSQQHELISSKPCFYYVMGACQYQCCRFSHDLSTTTCRYWMEGCCFKSSTCPFLHEKPSLDDPELPQPHCASLIEKPKKENTCPPGCSYKLDSETDFPSLASPENKNNKNSAQHQCSKKKKKKGKKENKKKDSSNGQDDA